MPFTRREFTAAALVSLVVANPVPAQTAASETALAVALENIYFGDTPEFKAGLKVITERGNPDMAAGLIRMLRFAGQRTDPIADALQTITGEKYGRNWFEWMLWQEQNPQIKPHPAHINLARAILFRVDPNFEDFLKREYLDPDKMEIRLEEIVWGGVKKDGIPSLDNPALIKAADADYMRGDDLVFGVSINGDNRAYPLRIMGWHEMFNEVIGGVPVALAYCTLCGSGILFETKLPGRTKPLVFGSSGFLYRSNKLMFDRETNSLWNQFTGKPVVGPLVGSGITLKQRPVVITTWDSWKGSHPDTKILSLKTGHSRDYGPGVVYSEYFGSDDLMFPAAVDQEDHAQKDYIFAVRQFGAARAWPLDAFKNRRVINDAIADQNLLLIGDFATRSVRAFERGDEVFTLSSEGRLMAANGEVWTITEDALVGPDGTQLARVAGHIAYWFAWDNYLGGAASIYEG
jgi:hypothetical protein